MATGTITHTVKSPSGSNLQGINVTARIKPFGFRSDDSQIAREQAFVTNSSGVVSMALENSADVDAARPAGYPAIASWYEVTVDLPADQGGTEVYCIKVAGNANLHDIIVASSTLG